MSRDPFKKLHRNLRMSGGRSQRANKAKHNTTEFHEVTVTPEDLRRKLDEQDGKCYWTGIPLDTDKVFESYDMEMPSVDRLDNALGYHYDNIVITTRFINVGRGRFSPERTRDFLTQLRLPHAATHSDDGITTKDETNTI